MKRHLWMAMAAVGVVGATSAQNTINQDADSLKVMNLQEVQVIATRATNKTPVAYTNVTKEEISKINKGQDIPYLLSMTPSAITTSDAGAGIGYTSLRVRGTDGTRINVTVNGVPMNDAESHNLFWVNMPDFASSIKDIQVQRGAGTSTNGAGAFGGSINMQTKGASVEPYAEVNGSYGSFNTHKETIEVGTGLLNDHWTFDARLSNIGTDGYIDRAAVDLKSYYLQGGYFGKNTSVKFITFAGKEQTYHAWNYASMEEMEEYGRDYNSCGAYINDDGEVVYYKNQTDNYVQKNYQLLFNHNFNPQLNLNVALHYTKGDGYYEEYKEGRSFAEYGLTSFFDGEEWVDESDLIRQKKMDNSFGGGVFSLNYTNSRLTASLGGGLNQYKGNNFGEVIWVKNYIGALEPNHEYYSNNANKVDGNIYIKASYDITSKLSGYADLQYRHIDYTIDGTNDSYDWNTGAPANLAVDETFDFFNPKVGLNWSITPEQRLYASFSVAQKEPTRNNYTDVIELTTLPKSEKLRDYELGYSLNKRAYSLGVNLYYMDYTDQLVLTGALNDIGEPLTENVKDSYRMGVELMAGVRPCDYFQWDFNATFSKNRIVESVETLTDYAGTDYQIEHEDTPIAYSPEVLLNNRFVLFYKNFEASLQSQFVGKQYLTNTQVEELTIDPYFVSNLNVAYSIRPKRYLKEIILGVTIYNLFNEEYENNGWGYSYHVDGTRYNGAGYAAQAGTNVLGNVSFRF